MMMFIAFGLSVLVVIIAVFMVAMQIATVTTYILILFMQILVSLSSTIKA